jgi:hypothetical protein
MASVVTLTVGQALRFSSAQRHSESMDNCRNARPHRALGPRPVRRTGAHLLEDRHILLNENLTIRNLVGRKRVHSFVILRRVSSKKLSRHCSDHARPGYDCIVEARRGECRVRSPCCMPIRECDLSNSACRSGDGCASVQFLQYAHEFDPYDAVIRGNCRRER